MKVRILPHPNLLPLMEPDYSMSEVQETIQIDMIHSRKGGCPAGSMVGPPLDYEVLEYRLTGMDGDIPEYSFARFV